MNARCASWLRAAAPALIVALVLASPAHADMYWVTVAGLGGEDDYEQRFAAEASEADRFLRADPGRIHVSTLSGVEATRARLTRLMTEVAHAATPDDQFVLLLIGHGSFDGAIYKFNLPGPDISAAQLAALCDAVPARMQLIVDTSSASGGAIAALQRNGRAVIASTKSGTEKNATVFARYWLEALQDPAADVDKSDSISALEAFEYAARKTAEFYSSEKRLATEHAVFEDVGKERAVRAPSAQSGEGRLLASLTLVRLGDAQQGSADPAKLELLGQKEKLLRQIDELKYRKAAMDESQYQSQLKSLLLQLAHTQASLDR
jgi:hypothetical protein